MTTAQLVRWEPPTDVGRKLSVPLPPMLVNVLESLCEGKPNAEIARDWGISVDTVKTHLKRLFGKIGARDRAHAVALVMSGTVEIQVKQADNRWSGGRHAVAAPVPATRTVIGEWL